MGREYLNSGFSLDNVYNAMTVYDESEQMQTPELYDAAGKKYKSLKDAKEAINKGKAVVLVEHDRGGNSNIVYCANGRDGKLAISPNKMVPSFSQTIEKANKRPSLGRRIASRFSRHKEKYADVTEYRASKAKLNETIKNGVQAEWKDHLKFNPVSSIQTMEYMGEPEHKEIIEATEKLRRDYSGQDPEKTPLDPGYEAPVIRTNTKTLKTHAKKRQLAASQNIKDGDYANAYPGIDTSKLTDVQKEILNKGLQQKVALYGLMSSQSWDTRWTGCKRAVAELAAAQYMYLMLYRAQRNPDCIEANNLRLFNTPEDTEKFISAIQEEVLEEDGMLVHQIYDLLETGDAAESLVEYAETAIANIRKEKAAAEAEAAKIKPEDPIEAAIKAGMAKISDLSTPPEFIVPEEDYEIEEEFTGPSITRIENSHIALNAMKEIMEKANGGPVEFSPQLFADLMLGSSLEESHRLKDTPGGGKFKEIFEFLNDPENANAAEKLMKEKLGDRPLTETELSKYVGAGDNSKMFNFIEDIIQENKKDVRAALDESKASVKKFEQVVKTGKKEVAPQQEVAPQVEANKPIL